MLAAELQFNEAEHLYHMGARKVPGVTQVLRQIDELEGIPHDILEAAAHFGRHVHIACDLYNKGVLDVSELDPLLVPYLAGWRKFLKDSGARVFESERRVYHKRLGYAGTLDAVVAWHTLPEVIDIKSSVTVPRSVRPQTAAYREALVSEGRKIGKIRYCVHLLGNENYKLHRYSDPADFNIFVSCLNVHNWMERP